MPTSIANNSTIFPPLPVYQVGGAAWAATEAAGETPSHLPATTLAGCETSVGNHNRRSSRRLEMGFKWCQNGSLVYGSCLRVYGSSLRGRWCHFFFVILALISLATCKRMCDVPCSKTRTHHNLLHQFSIGLKPPTFFFLIPVFGR